MVGCSKGQNVADRVPKVKIQATVTLGVIGQGYREREAPRVGEMLKASPPPYSVPITSFIPLTLLLNPSKAALLLQL